MKTVSRKMIAGIGFAGAVALTVVAVPGAAFAAAPAQTPAVAHVSAGCAAHVSGTSVSGDCTVTTPLGAFGGSFSGSLNADLTASGTITLDGGVLGQLHGTWTGGPFTGASAMVDYTVMTPVGPISGSFSVAVS